MWMSVRGMLGSGKGFLAAGSQGGIGVHLRRCLMLAGSRGFSSEAQTQRDVGGCVEDVMQCDKQTRLVVGMSGGVDSAVSAQILVRSGYNVVAGVHMINWDASNDESLQDVREEATKAKFACQEEDERDVSAVCAYLGIPMHRAWFVQEYWTQVWEKVLQDYASGLLTPNPDVLCNQHIKAHALPAFVLEKLDASVVALGHYARKVPATDKVTGEVELNEETGQPVWKLLQAKDRNKDQTYFLCTLSQAQLSRIEFPLGGYTSKDEVKEVAREAGEENPLSRIAREKKESMGVCFIGKRNSFKDFLEQYLPPAVPGEVRRWTEDGEGEVISKHEGLSFYTIGQRLRLSGAPDKFYVAGKAVRDALHAHAFSWVRGSPPPELLEEKSLELTARVRHRGDLIPCSVSLVKEEAMGNDGRALLAAIRAAEMKKEGKEEKVVQVRLHSPAQAAAPGQYVALYDGDECLGGGKVVNVLSKADVDK